MGPKESPWDCRKADGSDGTNILLHIGIFILDTIITYKFEINWIRTSVNHPCLHVPALPFILLSSALILLAGPLGLVIYKRGKETSVLLIIILSSHPFFHFTWHYVCHSKWYSINSTIFSLRLFAFTYLKHCATWSFPFKLSFLCSAKRESMSSIFMGHKVTIYASFISFSNLWALTSISEGIFKIIFCLRNYNNDQRNGSWNKCYSMQAVPTNLE